MSDLEAPQEGIPLSSAFQESTAPSPARVQSEKRSRFFSLRLTFAEHAALVQAAGNVPLGVYIRAKLFDQPIPEYRPRKVRQPIKDHQALASVLGELGKSRIANNLNQLAKAANSGSLPLSPETERSLREACAGVQWLRTTLMQALGLQA